MSKYNWDDYDDSGFERLPQQRQVLKNYFVYEAVNTNGKPFLMFKFARAQDIDEKLQYDENGKPVVYPHTTIQVYYEAGQDFGKKVLKNLLKAEFGEERLSELTDNEKIIHYVNKEMPLVSALVYYEGDYTKCKEFEFKPVEVDENYEAMKADLDTTEKADLDTTEAENEAEDDGPPF